MHADGVGPPRRTYAPLNMGGTSTAPVMPAAVVEVHGLTKHYPPDIKAVDGVDFRILGGEVFSLLGPNGAGKTTTVEVMEGLRDPTGGGGRGPRGPRAPGRRRA